MITLFHVIPVIGCAFGSLGGFTLGSRLGTIPGIMGGILGGGVGLVCGRMPLALVLKSMKRDFSGKTPNDLRAMLRSPGVLAPNVLLLELRARGENVECELPIVLDMLTAPAREVRIRGWHALVSAFPEQARSINDYRIDDPLDESRRKIQKLRIVEPGEAPAHGSAMQPGNPGAVDGLPPAS